MSEPQEAGAGAERQALEIIDAMGLRNVVVKDKRLDREYEPQEIRRKSAGLSTRDAWAIRDAVPGVERGFGSRGPRARQLPAMRAARLDPVEALGTSGPCLPSRSQAEVAKAAKRAKEP